MNLLRLGLLGGDSLLAPVSGLFRLGAARLRLIRQLLRAKLLCLLLVNVFHQDALVLEHVSLALGVEFVVQMAVDLLALAVFLEKPAEDSHPTHPQLLRGHPGVGRSLSLAHSGVAPLAAG